MKADDVIEKLASTLPRFTSKFTTEVSITNLISDSGVATATSNAHGLKAGELIIVAGVKTPIALSSISRSGTIATLVTIQDHDVTENAFTHVEIQGANESEFNGSFAIISVPNRRTIHFTIDNSGPLAATGSILLMNGSSILNTYNGMKPIVGVTPNTFTFPVPTGVYSPPDFSEAVFRTSPRISGAVSFDRLVDAYTKQAPESYWLFVVINDDVASKDRNILSDAVSNTSRSSHYRQQVIQSCSIFVVMPVTDQLSGRKARDEAQNLFKPICQSILMEKFDTGLSIEAHNPLQFISHGLRFYNTAVYIHEYQFEQVADLSFNDTIGYSEDVAFRDIVLDMKLSHGTLESFVKNIDLDDEIL